MLNHEEKLKIKAQTKLSIRDCGGQEVAVEASSRLSRHQSFSEFADVSRMDKFICVDAAIELDRFSGNPRFAKLFAKMNGGMFVPLPAGVSSGCLERAAGKSASEFGDVMVAIGQSLKDGKLDNIEAKAIVKEIHEAVVALASLAENVKSEAKK